jgi:predicted RNase H-like nuclease (RuvC/YqgF family)
MEEEQGAVGTGAAVVSKKKHEEKYRKKDPKSWENISKAIATMEDMNKLSYIEQKYQQLYNDVRRLTLTNQQLTRQNTAVQKERDHNQAELTKSIVARARLENLCRELQKQNKQIKVCSKGGISISGFYSSCRKKISLKSKKKRSAVKRSL